MFISASCSSSGAEDGNDGLGSTASSAAPRGGRVPAFQKVGATQGAGGLLVDKGWKDSAVFSSPIKEKSKTIMTMLHCCANGLEPGRRRALRAGAEKNGQHPTSC